MRPRRVRVRSHSARAVAAGLLVAAFGGPAFAQVAGGVTVQNDYRLRGYSISNDRPVGIVDISYDHASGFYANGSVIAGERRDEDMTVVGMIGNVGYARRINSRVTLDAGVVHIDHLAHYSPGATGRYTEGYVGVNAGDVSARLSYSPNYLRDGLQTLYAEINGGVGTVAKLRLNGHLGYLACLDSAGFRCVDRVVWRVGVSRQFNRLELHASLTGAMTPSGDPLRLGDNPALVVGTSWTF